MRTRCSSTGRKHGSVLVIVLWIAFGLVSIALYFGQSMSFELRAADNRVAAMEADQAIEGAARYVSYVLTHNEEPGRMPDYRTYKQEEVPLGDSLFWIIGRDEQMNISQRPAFGLIDEASKLNLNTATVEMLQTLPGMTVEFAAAIIDWRDTDSEVSENGAEAQAYTMIRPAYTCKNAPFETVEELRMVKGADLKILFSEDTNLNGILDVNENDALVSLPEDNKDGRLDAGIFDYVTIYSRQPNTRTNGQPRINVTTIQAQQLQELLTEKLSASRVTEVLARVSGPGAAPMRSVLEFAIRSGMTAEEFALVERELTASSGQYVDGLININTASEAVLACIPGIGTDKASTLVAYRQSNPDKLTSLFWISEALGAEAVQAGPYITGQSYVFTADIAAVGHFERGYRRTRFVFDTCDTTPRIVYRKDMTDLGWALGMEVRQRILQTQQKRT
jgi:DNA uptake protein ComE-like DNA-binding protein